MKHTEGKWIVKAQSGMLGVGVVSVHTKVDGKKIFICDLPVKDVGETKSNANLIASAPEMLEMLKYISKLNKHNGGMYQMFSNIMGSDPAHEIGNKLLGIIAWAEEGR